jgi:hypothetical protein
MLAALTFHPDPHAQVSLSTDEYGPVLTVDNGCTSLAVFAPIGEQPADGLAFARALQAAVADFVCLIERRAIAHLDPDTTNGGPRPA